ncbi:DUF1343 domain-containing protein [Spirosoma sp. SC4-14]|uniref:exo-beta-N-acetylmuramidase NamZ family protein n=1 Tax=Spirosoma sp. SC4-14 TaxID=3128900 RepID=UPI0030D19CC0
MSVRFGIDLFLEEASAYANRKLAFVTNEAATTTAYTPSRLALLQRGFAVMKLFAPEHGLEAIGEDGKQMPDGRDVLTGLPVISLYGNKLRPATIDLVDVDTIVVDLPDIGCRFYTYLWTLSYLMEACCEAQKKLIVLDRPNPISGRMELIEGPMLDEAFCASFIGRWRMPLRASCTMGELARFWQNTRFPALTLTVVPVEGWQRWQFASDWQPSFIPTSPAMVSAEATQLYPGLGLLEATNLSEGRGTATPFQIAGAPWLSGIWIAEAFNALRLSGVIARAITFTPLAGRYKDQLCGGCMFHVTDKTLFRPVWSILLFIKLVADFYPNEFEWATYPTHVNSSGTHHLDKLLGIHESEALFAMPMNRFQERVSSLLICTDWIGQIAPFLLY